jgi:hypothetical protein
MLESTVNYYTKYTEQLINETDEFREKLKIISKRILELNEIKNKEKDIISDIKTANNIQCISSYKDFATKLLKREAILAAEITKEFSVGIFTERLNMAIDDPNTIELIPIEGTSNINVIIDLSTTAGTIEDWANAVDVARRELNISIYSRHPVSARERSERWVNYYDAGRNNKDIINKKGKDVTYTYYTRYWDTIYKRLDSCTSLAPWWEILQFGTIKFPEDTSGTAYPIIQPTRFVDIAITKIKNNYYGYCNKRLNKLNIYIESKRNIKNINKAIEDAKLIKREIIENLKSKKSLEESTRKLREITDDYINTNIERNFPDTKEFLNEVYSFVNKQVSGVTSKIKLGISKIVNIIGK